MSIAVLMRWLLSSRLANDWTRHAVAAAASATELLPGDGEHLDARLGELRVGRFVPLVPNDDAGLDRDDVVAVVPLVSLGLELVAAGRDDLHVGDPERVPHLVEEGALRHLSLDAGRPAGTEEDGPDLRNDRLIQRCHVSIAEGEDRIEVHRRPLARHLGADHEARRLGFEHVAGKDADSAGRAALAHPDQDDAVARGHDVSTLEPRETPIVVGAAEPDLEV